MFLLASCANGPSVNLATRAPIKVDINMNLDVYQHAPPAPKTATVKTGTDEVATRRRDRMGEIQIMKDSRFIGENHLGLLAVQNLPPGDYGKYVQRMVDAENSDRESEMQRLSRERKIPLSDIRSEQAKLTRANAFKGEWIEAPQPNGIYEWVKQGG